MQVQLNWMANKMKTQYNLIAKRLGTAGLLFNVFYPNEIKVRQIIDANWNMLFINCNKSI